MKRNTAIKAIASILLSMAMVVAVISGIVFLETMGDGSFTVDENGHTSLYMHRLETITEYREQDALTYYRQYIQAMEDGQDREKETLEWKTQFDRQHSNYGFSIKPLYDTKYPELKNFEVKTPIYSNTSTHTVSVVAEEQAISGKIDWKSIVDEWKNMSEEQLMALEDRGSFYDSVECIYRQESIYRSESVYEEADGYIPADVIVWYGSWDNIRAENFVLEVYQYSYYATEMIDEFAPILRLDGTNLYYSLAQDPDWKTIYDKFISKAAKKKPLGQVTFVTGEYDAKTQKVTMYLRPGYSLDVELTSKVASEFTAHDAFYESVFLDYIDSIIIYARPALIISLVLCLVLGIYLIWSAGYRKNQDKATLNWYDRIPLDIHASVLIICMTITFEFLDYYEGMSTWLFLGFWGACCALLVPPFVMTIVTRFRVEEFGLFRNTVCYKLWIWTWKLVKICFAFCWKAVKRLWNKTCETAKLLQKNVNLYWKWLGVWTILAFVEGLMVASDANGAAIFLGFVIFVGISVYLVRVIVGLERLRKGAKKIAAGDMNYQIDTSGMPQAFVEHAENLNSIQNAIAIALEERMKSERMKTELITNVSHDIKTPLTSIISYVDLLSKEQPVTAVQQEYIDVLVRQSARLKKLIEDLIEASKASSGNLEVNLTKIDVETIVNQAVGEFERKLSDKNLKLVVNQRLQDSYAIADGRYLWRILENLLGNVVKYAQPGSRVYIDMQENKEESAMLEIVVKNISAQELNLSGEELMERFVRGDASRNTEGSGLGLSIANSLARLQKGKMQIVVDGDLFKVVLSLVKA
ncbi:MAG: sensor histidine kinase [Wujia sp.]